MVVQCRQWVHPTLPGLAEITIQVYKVAIGPGGISHVRIRGTGGPHKCKECQQEGMRSAGQAEPQNPRVIVKPVGKLSESQTLPSLH